MQVTVTHKSAELLNLDVHTAAGILGVILSLKKRSGAISMMVAGSNTTLSVEQIHAFKDSLGVIVVDNRFEFEVLTEKTIEFAGNYEFTA